MTDDASKPPGGDETPKQGGGFRWMTLVAVIGLIWMTLSGLCTAAVVFPTILSPYGGGIAAVALTFGGSSFALGYVTWSLSRRKK